MANQVVFASVVLAGVPPTDIVSALRIATRQANQVAELVRADNPMVAQRGNRTKDISLTIERTFTALLDAEKFVHDHAADIATSGSLVITLSDGSTTRTFAGAVPESVDCQLRGMSVKTDYVFVGTTVA